MPKLSIIIPCYNCAGTLQDAVESLYAQGLDSFEIVMVDDCSTDETADLMKVLSNKHPEIRLFSHEKNKGGGATRNTAIKNTRAEVIFCLDSDDMLPEGTLAKMYAYMMDKRQHGEKCDGVAVHRSIKFKNEFRGRDKAERIDIFGYADQRIPFDSLLQREGVHGPLYSVFMHTKEAFEITGGYPEDHGFDTQGFAWRFLANGLVAYTCPDAEYLHRLHSGGFYASYYTREARAGRINKNWFMIFAEFLYLFDPMVKDYILSFDLAREENLYDTVREGFDPVFVKGYESLLDPHERVRAVQAYSSAEKDIIAQKIATPLAPVSQRRRIIRKLRRMARKPAQFVHEISTRFGSRHQLSVILSYLGLVLKQAFKVGFVEDCASVQGGKEHGEKIDIVIPTISKDWVLFKEMVESLKKNLCNRIGDIYIVSRQDEKLIAFCKERGYTFVEEKSVLGYGKERITYMVDGVNRSGWLFQQLLKLSGEKIVKTRRYLIVDSDTVLIHPHVFLEGKDNDKVVFRHNTEWHESYFRSFQVLFGYDAPTRLSFTSHMMLFDTEYLAAMKKEIETKKGKPWDQAYMDLASTTEPSVVSDYDTYANWVLYNHPDKVIVKPLYNAGLPRKEFDNLENLTRKYGAHYKTLSFHSWIK